MPPDKLTLVAFAVALIALWLILLKFRWPERTYDAFGSNSFTWFWLDVFRVPKTRENCVKFMRRTMFFLVILVAFAALVVLIWGH